MTQTRANAAGTDAHERQPRKRRANQVDFSVGSRLRQARLLAGASQEDVASAIGVTFQAVHKYERGKTRLSVGTLAAAAEFLNLPISFFVEGDTEPQAKTDGAKFTAKEMKLVRHYRAIRSDAMREHLLHHIRLIGKQR